MAEWLPQMVMFVTFGHIDAGFLRELGLGAVFVEARHCEPAIARDRLRVVHRDQAIGVARISDHEDAHILGGVLLDRLSLADEDLAVDAEQIAAFHPGFARDAADEQRPVHIAEAFVQIGRRDDCL